MENNTVGPSKQITLLIFLECIGKLAEEPINLESKISLKCYFCELLLKMPLNHIADLGSGKMLFGKGHRNIKIFQLLLPF